MQYIVDKIIDNELIYDGELFSLNDLIYQKIVRVTDYPLYNDTYIILVFSKKISNNKYDNSMLILRYNNCEVIRGYKLNNTAIRHKIIDMDIHIRFNIVAIVGITIDSIRFSFKSNEYVLWAKSPKFENIPITCIGERGIGNTKIYFPTAISYIGIYSDIETYVLISDMGNNRIIMKSFTDDSNIYEIGLPENSYITDIYVDEYGNIFITDKKNNKIYVLTTYNIANSINNFNEIIDLNNLDPDLIRASKIIHIDTNNIYILQNDARTGIYKFNKNDNRIVDKFLGKFLQYSALVIPPYTIEDDEEIDIYTNPIKLAEISDNNIYIIYNGLTMEIFYNYI